MVSTIYMLVSIREKSPYTYRHDHTSMGPHTRMVIIFDTVRFLLIIGPHTGISML